MGLPRLPRSSAPDWRSPSRLVQDYTHGKIGDIKLSTSKNIPDPSWSLWCHDLLIPWTTNQLTSNIISRRLESDVAMWIQWYSLSRNSLMIDLLVNPLRLPIKALLFQAKFVRGNMTQFSYFSDGGNGTFVDGIAILYHHSVVPAVGALCLSALLWHWPDMWDMLRTFSVVGKTIQNKHARNSANGRSSIVIITESLFQNRSGDTYLRGRKLHLVPFFFMWQRGRSRDWSWKNCKQGNGSGSLCQYIMKMQHLRWSSFYERQRRDVEIMAFTEVTSSCMLSFIVHAIWS